MIDVSKMTDIQVRETALSIISREMGAAGLLRFIKQYENGYGDYSQEREDILKEESIDSIVNRIKARKKRP